MTFDDNTQKSILPHLQITEHLIIEAIEKESGKMGDANIIAMPDLGFANNAIRMRGGFFTGMYVNWNSEIPFVPVDATVNSCGVSIFSLRSEISLEEFKSRISDTKKRINQLGYNWNFERGNHFISLCHDYLNNYYLVMHASADEYKKEKHNESLYPIQGGWYFDEIKTVYTKDRYLRYICGSQALKFTQIAKRLENINHDRMNSIASMMASNYLKEEVIYVSHYGMPSSSSVSIGCTWNLDESILLSRPGNDIYIVKNKNPESSLWLTPHGFGSHIASSNILYRQCNLEINGVTIIRDEDVALLKGKVIRGEKFSTEQIEKYVCKILEKTNAIITNRFHPIITINKDGITLYD